MDPFSIDREKCRRDGICVAECPMMIIERNEDDDFPMPTKNFEALCINCGHCVAVCPHSALSLSNVEPDQCDEVMKDALPTSFQMSHHLKSRRSIRAFKEKSVPRADLEALLDTARYAPSGHNLQPVEWLVIYDRDVLTRLTHMVLDSIKLRVKSQPELSKAMHLDYLIEVCEAGKKRICRGAPHLIFAHAHKDALATGQAGTIALSYLEIMAPAMGLGACWGGYYGLASASYPPFVERLGLPDGHKTLGAMLIGYPKYQYHRIPLRNELKVLWQ